MRVVCHCPMQLISARSLFGRLPDMGMDPAHCFGASAHRAPLRIVINDKLNYVIGQLYIYILGAFVDTIEIIYRL